MRSFRIARPSSELRIASTFGSLRTAKSSEEVVFGGDVGGEAGVVEEEGADSIEGVE